MSEASTQTATRFMRMSEVLSLTGIKSRSTIYELQAAGDFPPAVHLTGKAIAFVESEVHGWIRSRVEARPAPEATSATRPPRLRHRTISQTTRPATNHQAASGATPPTSTSSTSESSTAPRRRGPARTRAQRQQAQGK